MVSPMTDFFLGRKNERERKKEKQRKERRDDSLAAVKYCVTHFYKTHRESQSLTINQTKRMNRIAFSAVVRAARINPAARPIVPYRWVTLIIE